MRRVTVLKLFLSFLLSELHVASGIDQVQKWHTYIHILESSHHLAKDYDSEYLLGVSDSKPFLSTICGAKWKYILPCRLAFYQFLDLVWQLSFLLLVLSPFIYWVYLHFLQITLWSVSDSVRSLLLRKRGGGKKSKRKYFQVELCPDCMAYSWGVKGGGEWVLCNSFGVQSQTKISTFNL